MVAFRPFPEWQPKVITNPDCPLRSWCLKLCQVEAGYLDCSTCTNIVVDAPVDGAEVLGATKLLLAIFLPDVWRLVVQLDTGIDCWVADWMKSVL